MIGVYVNFAAVVIGGLVGTLIRGGIPISSNRNCRRKRCHFLGGICMCKRQVFFHNFRQLIFHKKRQLIFHTYHVFDTHGLLRGLYCFYLNGSSASGSISISFTLAPINTGSSISVS